MTYAEPTDVKALIQGYITITDSSKPTAAQVEDWLIQYSANVNAALKQAGYDTPVTGANDLEMLRAVVAEGVARKALSVALNPPPADFMNSTQSFSDFLRALRKGETGLIDQDIVSSVHIGFLSLNIDASDS